MTTAFEEALARNGVEAALLERARQVRDRNGQRLGRVLTDLGVMSQEQVYQCYADALGFPLWDGEGVAEIREELGREFLSFNRVLPVSRDGNAWLVVDDPEDDGLIDQLSKLLPAARIAVCPPNRLAASLDALLGTATDGGDDGAALDTELDVEHLKDMALEAPIIRQVNDMINSGIEIGASDIHLEPFKNRIELRYRVDGVLHNRPPPTVEDYPAVVSRIKIIGGMDIAERRLPQDGRIRIKGSGRDVDIRVSSIPTLHGEDIVLRLLDQKSQGLSLEATGLSQHIVTQLRESLDRSHGLLLVTGPTGSGKTTTLYSSLKEIIDGRKKIITVEDPVEYEIGGISQIQVNDAAGMGFANVLRSILRHDPDVVFIGEIRDRETAEIAVQASLTGHLVLSTIHTNSAVGAIGRFLDMGIADYLLASSLIGVTAQRLVRELCPQCREPVALDDALAERFGLAPGRQVFRAVGCAACARTGYSGRFPISEYLAVDARLRHEILHDPSIDTLTHTAQASGYKSLLLDGIDRILDGQTTIDEVLRVAG